MTERAKRNEVEEADLFSSSEYLVFGAFREDSEDEGFSTTRWMTADDISGLTERPEKLDALAELLSNVREHLWMDEE